MTKEVILAQKKDRLVKLTENRGDKNIKNSGVVKKLKREIRNLENSIC